MNLNQTKYKKFIDDIITTRGQWTQLYDELGNPIPYENHHIIPRCVGGIPLKINHKQKHPNLIWLTLEEHFTAHKLLAIENPDNEFLVNAFSCMVQYGKYVSEEDFALNKKLLLESPKTKWHQSINSRTKADWAESINKRRKTNYIRYGEHNYSNQAKRVKTLKNKTESQKLETYNKWKNSNFNKSEEELLAINKKKSESHLNRSDEAKQLTKQKYLATISKRTREDWLAIYNKGRQTFESRSPEDKWRTHEKKSNAVKGGANPRAIPVICLSTGEQFGCIREAAKMCNTTEYYIIKSIKNKVEDNHGRVWCYAIHKINLD